MSNKLAKALKKKTDAMLRLQDQTQKPVIIQAGDGSYSAQNPADYTAALAAGKNIQILTSGNIKTIHAVMGILAGNNISVSAPDPTTGKVTVTGTISGKGTNITDFSGKNGYVLTYNSTSDKFELALAASSYTLPQATETTLGGVKAKVKTTEITEVAIDPATGKLYGPAAGEAENGIPAGGSAGQVLSKVDGTDFNAEWVDVPASSGSSAEAPFVKPQLEDFNVTRAGTGVIANNSKGIRISAPGTSSNVNNLIYCLKNIVPGVAGWRTTMRIHRKTPLVKWGMMGLIIRNSTDGKSVTYALGNDSVIGLNRNLFSSDTTFAGVAGIVEYYGLDIWLRIVDDLTNRILYCSTDGIWWQQVYSELRNVHTTADQVGAFINPNYGSTGTSINVRADVGMEIWSFVFEQLD
ncbi:hypothetical protein DSECCO2_567360 [anaerobic digester metagenome]